MIVTPPAPSPVLVDPRLLPTGLRRSAAVVAAGCAVALVLLGVLVAHTAAPTSFDAWGEHLVRGLHVLPDGWTDVAVAAGEPVFVVAVAVLVGAWCAWRRRWRPAAVVVAGPGLTGIAELVLKPLVGRTIATGDLAFPSGHTAGATALVLALTLVVAGVVRERRVLALTVGALLTVAVAVVVAVGLVAERAHYPTDTIGGFCLAVVMTVVAAAAIDRAGDRRSGA
ncbi:membrane protein [Pseudonocardia sulfidoxydans NBRC 16205]|uniref:Membrane protein n=1 Tax=Pseudonocardia sulfidoxydans NBRC 16205 TaxID=1223511 RepID=A0A511DKB1_9PSEU|nr:phosphatase PAP2 family protein [Pseudonocardia sulfidoxydans]GEL24224.1 membrane protein [Pseudonocardia sulfidoxydans NBRC 16205]